jgi:beta-lactam-binding protein with PASTA domain
MTPIIIAVCMAALSVAMISGYYMAANLFDGGILDIVTPRSNDRTIEVSAFVGDRYNLDNEARWELMGYNLVIERVYHSYFEPGIIVSQEPRAGAIRLRGAFEMRLFVSRGPDTTAIANYVMLDHREVRSRLEARGITVIIEEVQNDAIPRGIIIRTHPEVGEAFSAYNNRVTLFVSSGPNVVDTTVPNLVGRTEQAARDLLREYNLNVGQITWEICDESPAGTVIHQSRGIGATVPKGTFIDLRMNIGQGLTIPNLSGYSYEDAVRMLQNLGLYVGRVRHVERDDMMPGMIVSQSPSRGTVALPGDRVNLDVSRAPDPVPETVVPTEPDNVPITEPETVPQPPITEPTPPVTEPSPPPVTGVEQPPNTIIDLPDWWFM